jgi:ABC-2 type transport system ATP-binding protein
MPVIEVQNLHKRYGERVAVEDVSFSVEAGEIFGILGPNGAGKTTTVETVEGLRRADGGRVTVLGLDPGRDAAELRPRIGAQLQEAALPDKLRVGEAVDVYASFYPSPRDAGELLEALGLADRWNSPSGKLSGGQKQRLSIALALIGDPEIAVLDELTTGLDPRARRDTWRLIAGIRDRGVTVVLVTHSMEEAERLCDRVALFDMGRVVALDTPAALAGSLDGGQRLRFRPREPLADADLLRLPEVTALEWRGDQVVVTGTGEVVGAVTAELARRGIVAEHLRVEQASLEDAVVALTASGFSDED